MFTPQKAVMVEIELKQIQVVIAEVLPQEEVVAQSTVDVFHNGTGADGALAQSVEGLAKGKVAFSEDLP
jgi:hypothetical protein